MVPSPIAHDADTGVAVAVTASPGTCAVLDCGCHTFAATHSHTGNLVSCSAPGAGEERITGSGSCRYFTASWASTPGAGSTGAPPGGAAGPATPIGQPTVCAVRVQPAGTQPNALVIVPEQPPAAVPPAETVPAPLVVLPGFAVPGVPATGPVPAVTWHWAVDDWPHWASPKGCRPARRPPAPGPGRGTPAPWPPRPRWRHAGAGGSACPRQADVQVGGLPGAVERLQPRDDQAVPQVLAGDRLPVVVEEPLGAVRAVGDIRLGHVAA